MIIVYFVVLSSFVINMTMTLPSGVHRYAYISYSC